MYAAHGAQMEEQERVFTEPLRDSILLGACVMSKLTSLTTA
jgi:hypothetical protein